MNRIFSMLLSLLLILSTFSIFASTVAEVDQGTWIQKTPMPTPRRSAAAVTLNGKIYVIGGNNVPGGDFIWCLIVEIYDPQTDTWTNGTPMPDSKGGSGMSVGLGAVVIDNKIYVVGGDNRTFCYDPEIDQWDDTLAEIPVNGRVCPDGYAGLGVVNGKMYVAKGSPQYPSGEYWTYSYDPSTDTWDTSLTPIPYHRCGFSFANIDGKLYAIGGADPIGEGARQETNRVDIYDPETDSWELDATPRMLHHRTDLQPILPVVNGKIYVMGGWNGYRALSEVEVYDPSTNTWTELAPMPTARWSVATAVFNRRIYAIGGNQYRYNLQSINEEFTLPSVHISGAVDIDPNTLNIKSKGRWITAYIELPETHDVNEIDVSTTMLNDIIPAEAHPISIGDEDNDGIPDLMVKFDRASVIEYIESSMDWSSPERTMPLMYEVTLTVTGMLYDGTPFEGSDTIRTLKFLKGQPTHK